MDSEKIRAKFKHHLESRIKDKEMLVPDATMYWLTYLCETQTEIAAQLADLNQNIQNKQLKDEVNLYESEKKVWLSE